MIITFMTRDTLDCIPNPRSHYQQTRQAIPALPIRTPITQQTQPIQQSTQNSLGVPTTPSLTLLHNRDFPIYQLRHSNQDHRMRVELFRSPLTIAGKSIDECQFPGAFGRLLQLIQPLDVEEFLPGPTIFKDLSLTSAIVTMRRLLLLREGGLTSSFASRIYPASPLDSENCRLWSFVPTLSILGLFAFHSSKVGKSG